MDSEEKKEKFWLFISLLGFLIAIFFFFAELIWPPARFWWSFQTEQVAVTFGMILCFSGILVVSFNKETIREANKDLSDFCKDIGCFVNSLRQNISNASLQIKKAPFITFGQMNK